ncbi:SICAvar, type I (fragment) [Plasmodium knowlesi strain H]|uniref:SICAvar, type I n=1 Tax=Plasmodium knowlesi (strain H) TaxID=5851 RepID=A0A1A7VYN0_PLAKH
MCIQNNKDNVDNKNSLASTGKLCSRLQCIQNYLNTTRTTEAGKAAEDVEEQVTKLVTKVSDNGVTDNETDSLCESVKCPNDGETDCVSKTTCKIMAKALKEIHTKGETGQEDYRIFKSTMRCVILNALAQKLRKHAQGEGYACAVEEGIEEALKKGEDKREAWCNDNGKKDDGSCQPCGKQHQMCTAYSINGKTSLMGKVLDELKNNNDKIQNTLSEISNKVTLCDRMNCIIKQWMDNQKVAGETSTTTTENFWKEKDGDVDKLWKELSDAMKQNGGTRTSGNGDCDKMQDATHSEKTACNYLHAGFEKLKSISSSITTNGGAYGTLYKDPSFVQTMGCFLLRTYAKHMQKESICDIENGIKKAFGSWIPHTSGQCTASSGPCIQCNWDDKNYDKCQINTNGGTTTTEVKGKLEKIVNKESDPNIKTMLTNINKRTSLCEHMKCIASHLNSSTGKQKAGNFWEKEGGEVATLWNQLSEAMIQRGGNDNGGQCSQMGDSGGTSGATTRPATDPERKACQYLTLGFNKLKQNPTSDGTEYPILSKDPSFAQTVGCFLLHAYAKHMKDKANCLVESGIKKAFKSWNPTANVTCTNGSSCIQCTWDDNDYDQCKITTNGNAKAEVTDKLKTVKSKMENEATTTLTEINKMQNLCDYIRCAAPRWFQNQMNGNTAPTKNWCDFWNGAVKTTLEELFQKIKSEGQNKSKSRANGVCTTFGDGNELSVERKACNHITAGLQHIKEISGNDQLVHQAVDCIALNMYADKIIDLTKKSCPIDEKTIQRMFEDWNKENNNNSSSSPPCNGGGGNNNVCFKCTRQPDFNSCKLSVDSSLVDKTTNGNCTSSEEHKKVQNQMKKLLEDKSQSNSINNTMQKTFSEITKMDHNFCTQVQCAAKKWKSTKNSSGHSSGVSWNDINNAAENELRELLKHMSQPDKQKEVEQYCNDKDANWDTLGHKQSKTNKAACLLFAAGLQHIYKNKTKDPVNGPSFGQTMGCLFLKEYAKQLKKMAEDKKKGHSWVHPYCEIDKGIKHAFDKINATMKQSSSCDKNVPNSCFECKQNDDYKDCLIGSDSVKSEVESIFQDQPNKNHMQQTLENTVCPILLTDLLTPFVPLAPVSIGLSAMAYYLWKKIKFQSINFWENMSGSSTNKELKCFREAGGWDSYKSQVEKQLSEIEDKGNLVDDILHIWCCISGAYDWNTDAHAPCDLLYYTVGSIIYNKLTEKDSFDTIMKEVHEILGGTLSKGKCSTWEKGSGTKLFGLMEKLSYYKLDPKHVWKDIEGDSEKVNCGGCANYLEELAEAFREVEEYCSDTLNEGKCKEIPLGKGHQGSPDYLLGLIYDIIPKPRTTEITEDGKQGKCSIKLPSELEHGEFGHLRNQCKVDKGYSPGLMKEMLRRILDPYRSPWNCANQIIRGACYAHGTEESISPSGERCTSLYYYIGSVLSGAPGEVQNFDALMKAAYGEIVIFFGTNEACTNIYGNDNIDKTTFVNMKKVYDYTRDYETIQNYVNSVQGGESPCIDNYYMYLDKVLSAYEYMSNECKNGNTKQWCQKFEEMSAERSLTELLQLKCSLKHTSDCINIPATVSGTLFGIGLPALGAFLSYKYDLLPSGIRKFFLRGGSGTRMRRSAFEPNSGTEMENFTEYYTENNSTTIDPTEYSTVAGSSSNLTTSTEDSSILYNEDGPSRSPSPPPSRKKRGGGNNRRGQNISYHSMER